MSQSLVGAALVALSNVCDGASSRDGAGFSQRDWHTGHDLAGRFRRFGAFASERQFKFAQKLARTYRRQLPGLGIDVEAMLAEAFVPVAAPPPVCLGGRLLRTTGKALQVSFAVAEDVVQAWLPRSHVEVEGAGPDVIVTMPAWLAAEKGLSAAA
jgi:hypothetical protein